MSDNTTIAAQTGGDVIATDDISGVKYQRVKVCFGADGVASDVALTNLLPVGGAVATGSAVSGNPILMGGSDGANARTVKLATDGTMLINGVQDSTTAGTLVNASSVVGPVSVVNRNVATFTIHGTYAGVTFVIEATDDGSNWYGLQCVNNATGAAAASWTPGTNATASYDAAIGGYTQVRVRATAWASGTANIGVNPQVFAYDPVVAALSQGLTASATTAIGNPVQVGGTYNSTLPTYTTGQLGQLQLTTKGEQLCAISNAGTTATVKAASTAAVAADPALVVTLSPNNGAVIGGTGGLVATKASNTAAVTTDISQVVALSPNSPLPTTTSATQALTNTNVNATGVLVAVKASAGNLFGFSMFNNTAAVVFLSFWNVVVGSVTLGTTAPTCIFALPASGALTVSPSAFALLNSGTGISFAAVTAYNGSSTASVTGSIFYK